MPTLKNSIKSKMKVPENHRISLHPPLQKNRWASCVFKKRGDKLEQGWIHLFVGCCNNFTILDFKSNDLEQMSFELKKICDMQFSLAMALESQSTHSVLQTNWRGFHVCCPLRCNKSVNVSFMFILWWIQLQIVFLYWYISSELAHGYVKVRLIESFSCYFQM